MVIACTAHWWSLICMGPIDAAEWSWWTTSAHHMLASSQLALQRTNRALVNSVCQRYWAQRKVKLHITISLHPQPTEAVGLIMKYGILYNISFWQDLSKYCTKSLHQELCPTLRQSTISLAHQCTNMASHFFHSCVLPQFWHAVMSLAFSCHHSNDLM